MKHGAAPSASDHDKAQAFFVPAGEPELIDRERLTEPVEGALRAFGRGLDAERSDPTEGEERAPIRQSESASLSAPKRRAGRRPRR